jgi:predicted nucleic-acid-binding Zn-ribbon protein
LRFRDVLNEEAHEVELNMQAHKLEQWLDSRGVSRNYPMCASNQWETGEIVSGTSVDGSGNVLPMAQMVCQNCGYVMFFAAAHRAGLAKDGG